MTLTPDNLDEHQILEEEISSEIFNILDTWISSGKY